MRLGLLFVVVGFILIVSGHALAEDKEFDTGLVATWWSSDNDDTGAQIAVPIRGTIRYGDFKALLLNAYTYTNVDPDEGSKQSLSSFLDTKLNFSYQMTGKMPFDVLMGLGLNLPTGYTDFAAEELVLTALPPDLLPISSFGEGFNVNPYIGISKVYKQAAAGFGLGYLWRGEYDYSELLKSYDPGDVFTVTAEASYDFTEALQARASTQYADYTTDTVDGDDYYQDGSLTLVGLSTTYALPSWQLDAGITGIFRGKAKYYTDETYSIPDEKNYGDEWNVSLVHSWFMTSGLSLKTHLAYLSMGENGYEEDSDFYAGGRQKFSLGTGMEKIFSETTKATLDLDLFSIKDKKNWYHPDDDYTFKGFTLSSGLHMTF